MENLWKYGNLNLTIYSGLRHSKAQTEKHQIAIPTAAPAAICRTSASNSPAAIFPNV